LESVNPPPNALLMSSSLSFKELDFLLLRNDLNGDRIESPLGQIAV
jgi:hypothetical protein